MNKLIFDPLEEYRDKFKPRHKQNVSEYFENLVKEAKVVEEDNQLTVKEINTLQKKIDGEQKNLNILKTGKNFLIFGDVAMVIAAIISIVSLTNGTSELLIPILVLVVAILLFILFIFLLGKKVNPRIKISQTLLRNLEEEKEEKIKKAYAQLAPLRALFDPTVTPKLLEKTIPLLKMDPLFDSKRFDYLHRKYSLRATGDENESVEFVQSGEIQGNPFILSRYLRMDMGTKTYSASQTYTYTTTVYRDGKPVRVRHSETLTATVYKPYPYYSNDTLMIYGNEAAESLSFSRQPVLSIDWNEKELNNIISDETKKLKKLTEEALKKGKQFTPLGNTKFEALFQAYDRDHEQQFRLLFTPLGQSEMLDLIQDKKEGFGDNFQFYKHKNLNFVRSRHAQNFDYSGDPSIYTHYDLAKVRALFNDYNNEYLRYFYFNIAPILAIPLYQQHKPHEFIYQKEYESHLSFYEHESTANHFSTLDVAHPLSQTKNILKTKLITKGSDYDIIDITAHGFRTEQRYENVRVSGQSGSHIISVPWLEYIPVSQSTKATIKVANEEQIKAVNSNDAFEKLSNYLKGVTGDKAPFTSRHVIAFLLARSFSDKDNEKLNDALGDLK